MKLTGLPYTVYVNRKLGLAIASVCPSFVSPNFITILSFAIFLIASFFLTFSNSVFTSSLVTVLFLLQYAMDSADGVLARQRNLTSKVGEWLDHSLDGLRIVILHLAVLWMMLLDDGRLSLLELAAFSISITSMAGNYITNQLKSFVIGRRSGELITGLQSNARLFFKIGLTPADFGVYYMLFFFVHTPYFLEIYFLWGLYFLLIFFANLLVTFFQVPQT